MELGQRLGFCSLGFLICCNIYIVTLLVVKDQTGNVLDGSVYKEVVFVCFW